MRVCAANQGYWRVVDRSTENHRLVAQTTILAGSPDRTAFQPHGRAGRQGNFGETRGRGLADRYKGRQAVAGRAGGPSTAFRDWATDPAVSAARAPSLIERFTDDPEMMFGVQAHLVIGFGLFPAPAGSFSAHQGSKPSEQVEVQRHRVSKGDFSIRMS